MDDNPLIDHLTPRELDILRLLADGLTSRQIADALVLSESTVRWYTKQIYSKLDVHHRTQALLRAQELGLTVTTESAAAPLPGRYSFPAQASSFVGRENDMTHIAQILSGPNCRLLTIVGAGGTGKTRLAIEIGSRLAERYRDGVRFIPLESVTGVQGLIFALADALKLTLSGQDEPLGQLLHFLRRRQLLLILDNFEVLLEGADVVADLVSGAPQVSLLVTSREPLKLNSEWLYPLAGLDVPPEAAGEDSGGYSAVRLFEARALQVQPHFSLADELSGVVRLVRLLEGMPLAIELAAGWTQTLIAQEIAGEVERDIEFLTSRMRDAPERHRSMRTVIESSYRRLTRDEQQALNRLSVFAGSAGREAAQAVTQASVQTLAALVDKSLLRLSPGGRYSLHELVRRFAESQLEAAPGEAESARRRHAAFYSTLIRRQSRRLRTHEQLTVLSALDAELDNLLAAWRAMIKAGAADEIRQMAVGLASLLDYRSHQQQAIELFEQAAGRLRAAADAESRAALGYVLARLAWLQTAVGAPEKGRATAEESLSLLQQARDPAATMEALRSFIRACSYLNAWPQAEIAANTGLQMARAGGDLWEVAAFLYWAGQCARAREDYAEALQLGEEGLALAEQTGDRWMMASIAGLLLGTTALAQGSYAEAQIRLERGLELYREIGQPWPIGVTLGHLGDVALAMNEPERATHYYLERLAVFAATSGHVWEVVRTLYSLARLLATRQQGAQAVELLAVYWQHPATLEIHRQQAEELLARLRAELPASVFEQAWEQGSDRALDGVIAELVTR